MNPTDFWKNFKLCEELSVSGAFIYNGLRRYHEMKSLEFTDELFEFLYDLSVGIERLLKIAVVLYEHDKSIDQDALEKSLITHNHLDLLARLEKRKKITLSPPQKGLLSLLSAFYKSLRYNRFSLASVYDGAKERQAIFSWLGKYLKVEFTEKVHFFGTPNEERYRRFVRRTTLAISRKIYKVIEERARSINLYTYELRHGSKAESVFLGEIDMSDEDLLAKELLVFFMNTQSSSGYLDFLRDIEPLSFDPECVGDYLDCFLSDSGKAFVLDELKELYSEMEDNKGERIELMRVIGAPNVYFGPDDEEFEQEEFE